MASVHRILFLVLAIAFATASLTLVFWGRGELDLWFENLTPAQQHWLPKVGMAISTLLAALGGFGAYRSRQREQHPT